jgi:hypothetical protein
VENFDHHCPFIDNCLGYRNHKYFIMFLFSFTMYLFFAMAETVRHVIEVQKSSQHKLHQDLYALILLVMIGCHVPVLLY